MNERIIHHLFLLFDLFQFASSVVDIVLDVIVTLEFYQLYSSFPKSHQYAYFFYSSLFIMLFAQVAYAFLFCVQYSSSPSPARVFFLFLVVFPFAQFVPFFMFLESSQVEFIKVHFVTRFNLKPSSDNLNLNASNSLFHKNVLSRCKTHFGFIIEAFVEAIPQCILQTIFICYSVLSDNEDISMISTLNSLSLLMSVLVIISKGYIFSYSADLATFFFKFFAIISDFIGMLVTFMWIFMSESSTATFVSWLYLEFLPIYVCIFVYCTGLFMCLDDHIISLRDISSDSWKFEFLFNTYILPLVAISLSTIPSWVIACGARSRPLYYSFVDLHANNEDTIRNQKVIQKVIEYISVGTESEKKLKLSLINFLNLSLMSGAPHNSLNFALLSSDQFQKCISSARRTISRKELRVYLFYAVSAISLSSTNQSSMPHLSVLDIAMSQDIPPEKSILFDSTYNAAEISQNVDKIYNFYVSHIENMRIESASSKDIIVTLRDHMSRSSPTALFLFRIAPVFHKILYCGRSKRISSREDSRIDIIAINFSFAGKTIMLLALFFLMTNFILYAITGIIFVILYICSIASLFEATFYFFSQSRLYNSIFEYESDVCYSEAHEKTQIVFDIGSILCIIWQLLIALQILLFPKVIEYEGYCKEIIIFKDDCQTFIDNFDLIILAVRRRITSLKTSEFLYTKLLEKTFTEGAKQILDYASYSGSSCPQELIPKEILMPKLPYPTNEI